MKKCSVWLLFLILITLAACENNGNKETTVNNEQPVAVDTQEASLQEVKAEETFPEPGGGTITSNTETPLKKQNQALYKSSDGKTINAVYYFDKENNGVVILQNGESDDIVLKQEKDDIPSNTAVYSNGTIEWSAAGNYAIFNNGTAQIEYKLVSMKQ